MPNYDGPRNEGEFIRVRFSDALMYNLIAMRACYRPFKERKIDFTLRQQKRRKALRISLVNLQPNGKNKDNN